MFSITHRYKYKARGLFWLVFPQENGAGNALFVLPRELLRIRDVCKAFVLGALSTLCRLLVTFPPARREYWHLLLKKSPESDEMQWTLSSPY